MGPMHWIHGWGLPYRIYPWGSALVMGKFDGETFLGGLLIFFLGGRRGKRKRQDKVSRVGRWTTRAFKQPHFIFILYIVQWKFRCSMSSGHRERWPRSSMTWADRCVVQASTADDLVHAFKTMEGLLVLVPPRTTRSSGYDVYAHAVYVAICYLSITCICLLYVVICYMSVVGYMSVICLVLGPS